MWTRPSLPRYIASDATTPAARRFIFEGRLIGAAQDEAHRIAVPTDARGVLFPRLSRTVAGKDMVDSSTVTGTPSIDVDAATASASEVAAVDPPRPGNRTPVVQLNLPTVPFGGQVEHWCGLVGQEHEPIVHRIR